jgi:hypothetical protein
MESGSEQFAGRRYAINADLVEEDIANAVEAAA